MGEGKRIAFVTCEAMPAPERRDALAAEALRARGHAVDAVPWSDPAAGWRAYDAVVVRTTWDYWLRAEAFAAWIDAREAEGARLWNPPAVLRWNLDKRYLRELAAAGIPVLETEWVADDRETLAALLARRGWDEAVVKPAVSAGAWKTFPVTADDAAAREADFREVAALGAMVQPFAPAIRGEGEWSFLFFRGAFSHAVLKRPAAGDFRVQEQHGGRTVLATPPDDLVAQAARVLEAAPGPTLYARVDGVVEDGRLVLMELEALEPSLFLEFAGAAGRFADAILAVA